MGKATYPSCSKSLEMTEIRRKKWWEEQKVGNEDEIKMKGRIKNRGEEMVPFSVEQKSEYHQYVRNLEESLKNKKAK